mmetsp:Transcript_17964/g.30563  ORF Transcript_17964/g.30563 Transcript_17964/m.30563 type:complete len:154 (-) Transcript_17964:33-494(-)
MGEADEEFLDVFDYETPIIESWEALRSLFGSQDEKELVQKIERPVIHKITHESQVSIFVRDPLKTSEAEFEKYRERLHELVPEWDFKTSHKRQWHHKYLCPEGDIFLSEGAMNSEKAKEMEHLYAQELQEEMDGNADLMEDEFSEFEEIHEEL